LDWAFLDLALTAAGGNSTLWEFGPAVPAVLHHQANGWGHRSQPVDKLRYHHAAARRQHQRRQQSRRIQRIHCAAAAPLM